MKDHVENGIEFTPITMGKRPLLEQIAIYIEEKHAVVDAEICENCNVCEYMCARGVIKEREVPEYNYLQRVALGLVEGE